MRRRMGAVHTGLAAEGGWVNRIDARVVSRHRYRDVAVAAGAAIARSLSVEHVIHDDDRAIGENAAIEATRPG